MLRALIYHGRPFLVAVATGRGVLKARLAGCRKCRESLQCARADAHIEAIKAPKTQAMDKSLQINRRAGLYVALEVSV